MPPTCICNCVQPAYTTVCNCRDQYTGAAQCPRTVTNPAPGGNASAAAAEGTGLLPNQVLCYGGYLNSAQSTVPAIALPCASDVAQDITCQAQQLSGMAGACI